MNGGRTAVSGFTLVEMLAVAIIFFFAIGGTVLALSQSGAQLASRTGSRFATITEAQRALTHLAEDARRARQGPTCGAGSLVLTLPDATTITYQCNACSAAKPGTLVRTVGGAPQTVASSLTEFQPTCVSNELVQLRVTAQVNTLRGPTSQTFESQVRILNP